MAQAENLPTTTHSLLGAPPFLLDDALAADPDARFLLWEHGFHWAEKAPWTGIGDDALEVICQEQDRLADLIVRERCSSLVGAKVKLRWAVYWAGQVNNPFEPLLKTMLASIA